MKGQLQHATWTDALQAVAAATANLGPNEFKAIAGGQGHSTYTPSNAGDSVVLRPALTFVGHVRMQGQLGVPACLSNAVISQCTRDMFWRQLGCVV